ncbi:hypothetical protein L0244_21210 [bacterium]|nr:hypothetical protein [bacterium]
MPREKKQFSGSVDEVISQANTYLKGKIGWEPIQLTYGSHKGVQIIAFTADKKNDLTTWKFVKVSNFASISGTKEVGIFYENDVPWFVGVPVE